MTSLRFRAVTSREVRWVRRQSGDWQFFEPPTDWEESDYEAARTGVGALRIGPVLTDEIYLATVSAEKQLLSCNADDLYAKFASIRPAPENIKIFVSLYGFLGLSGSHRLNRRATSRLHRLLDRNGDLDGDLRVERVTDWLYFHHVLNFWLTQWDASQRKQSRKAVKELTRCFPTGSLTFALRFDLKSKRVRSELVAPSLSDALTVQFGMAVAAGALPRQCLECPNWFDVSHGRGRPEKLYCSAACKMRGWRQRGAVT